MREVLIAAWAWNILAEAALVTTRIIQWRRRRSLLQPPPSPQPPLPVFSTFIAVDLIRSVSMFAIWLWGTRQQYAVGFMLTEWPDMILLCASGVEAFARRFSTPPAPWVYGLIVGLVLAVGYGLPPAENVPLNRMFMQRSLVAFCTVAVILSGSAWCERLPGWHGGILALYSVFDLIAYFSLALFPEWAKADPYSAPVLTMAGGAVCMMGWAWVARAARMGVSPIPPGPPHPPTP